jgi:hypothetical protein
MVDIELGMTRDLKYLKHASSISIASLKISFQTRIDFCPKITDFGLPRLILQNSICVAN